MTTLTKEQYTAFTAAWANLARSKKLTAAHFVFRNLLLDQPVTNGFTPLTNPNRLWGRAFGPTDGLVNAINEFKHRVNRYREAFLSDFDGVVTDEMIDALELPTIPSYPAHYGLGRKFYNHVVENPVTSITYDDLWPLIADISEKGSVEQCA